MKHKNVRNAQNENYFINSSKKQSGCNREEDKTENECYSIWSTELICFVLLTFCMSVMEQAECGNLSNNIKMLM